ncbi:MAG: WD40 repeat domain-containing protein, partial [Candidatus Hodarchaeota archaeon]
MNDKDSLILIHYGEGHDGSVTSLCVDSTFIYTGSEDGTIRVWDKDTFTEQATLTTNSKGIKHMYLDEGHLYSVIINSLIVWDTESFEIVGKIEVDYQIFDIIVDNDFIYLISSRDSIEIWSKKNLQKIKTLTNKVGREYSLADACIDDKYLYLGFAIDDRSADFEMPIHVIDKNEGKFIKRLQGQYQWLRGLAHDSEYLYSAGSYSIMMWDKISFERKNRLFTKTRTGKIFLDAEKIYCVMLNSIVSIREKKTLEEVFVLKGHFGEINDLFVDEQFIYTASADSTVRVWDKQTFKHLATLGQTAQIRALIEEDDQNFYLACYNGCIAIKTESIFESSSLENQLVLESQRLDLDADFLYAGGKKESYMLEEKHSVLRGHTSPVTALALDNTSTYSGSRNGTLQVRNKITQEQINSFKAHEDQINSIAVDKRFIYSVSKDKTLRIWDKLTFELKTIIGGYHLPKDLLYMDERFLYSRDPENSGFIVVGDRYSSKDVVAVLEADTQFVFHVISDQDYIYSGYNDGTVRIWNKRNFREEIRLRQHTSFISCLYYDDKFLYTGSCDKKIMVWSKTLFTHIATLEGHSSEVTDICTDEKRIYSLSHFDNTLRIWDKKSFTNLSVVKLDYGSFQVVVDSDFIYTVTRFEIVKREKATLKILDRQPAN